ncbi:MAG: glycosyltransferase [Phycisphaera sp.]|nr:glycosyltransferase [Phycisphaera sp.]
MILQNTLLLIYLALALLPVVMVLRNSTLYRAPGSMKQAGSDTGGVSLLIPARNEEKTIRRCVEAALQSVGVDLEIIVLDDHSDDATASIVKAIAERDGRLRLATAPPLPGGWCGKQHACYELSKLARHDVLCFIDADVELAPDALARAAGFLHTSGAALVSGFPRQATGSFMEKLLIPLIHFVLLGYLPMKWMRQTTGVSFGAGCGQFFVTRREAYTHVGGHAAIRSSLHDGLMLPRAFRARGYRTDLFDATSLARCRMYHGAGEVFRGLTKNATEGMATRAALPWWTLILGVGQAQPFVVTLWWLTGNAPWGELPRDMLVLASCTVCVLLIATRLFMTIRYRQSLLGALLHPVGITLLLVIQWVALVRRMMGKSSGWKGRAYAPA